MKHAMQELFLAAITSSLCLSKSVLTVAYLLVSCVFNCQNRCLGTHELCAAVNFHKGRKIILQLHKLFAVFSIPLFLP